MCNIFALLWLFPTYFMLHLCYILAAKKLFNTSNCKIIYTFASNFQELHSIYNMKAQIRLFLALLAVVTLAVTACKNSEEKTSEDSSASIENFETKATFKSATASYKCLNDTTFGKDVEVYTIRTASIQWPEQLGGNDLKALQDSLIANVFSMPSMPIDNAIEKFLSSKPEDEDCQLQKIDSVPTASDKCRILAKSVNAHSIGFTDKYIVYKIEEYVDNGGAHPVFANTFLNYDIKNNRVMNFDNMFTKGNNELLLDVIKATLCDMFYAQSLSELGERSGIFTDQIFVSHNIYISDTNVVFYYNPYDIAPWAVGPIAVVVPEYDLDQFLTPEARELFK